MLRWNLAQERAQAQPVGSSQWQRQMTYSAGTGGAAVGTRDIINRAERDFGTLGDWLFSKEKGICDGKMPRSGAGVVPERREPRM